MGNRAWPWKNGLTRKMGDSLEDAPSYILETRRRSDIGKVEGVIADYLPEAWSVRPLFDKAVDEVAVADFNLSCFWDLRLPGPEFTNWTESPYDLAYELIERTNVLSIEPDLPSGIDATPNAASALRCNEPKTLEPTDRAWALRSIRAPEAWKFLKQQGRSEGRDILIAQPDTGVADHVELAGCIDMARGTNLLEVGSPPVDPLIKRVLWDSPGHGTGTSSVAVSRGGVLPTSASPDFGTSAPGHVTGVSRDSKIVPIRAIKSVIRVTQKRVAQAVHYSYIEKCHVISMSLGGLPLRALEAAIAYAVSDQLLVLAAAGNCVKFVVYPARYDSVIGIGGTNERRVPWKGSSRGPRVDVCAPAEFVWRALRTQPVEPKDIFEGGQGTSFATAMTAGVAALWLNDRRAQLINVLGIGSRLQDSFRHCLKVTAKPSAGWDFKNYGAGIVDAFEILNSQCGTTALPQSAPPIVRQPYRPQVEDTCVDILELRLGGEAVELASRVRHLAPGDKERFGHEILALLMQRGWIYNNDEAALVNQAGLLILHPSRQLSAALQLV
jgi:serine protease